MQGRDRPVAPWAGPEVIRTVERVGRETDQRAEVLRPRRAAVGRAEDGWAAVIVLDEGRRTERCHRAPVAAREGAVEGAAHRPAPLARRTLPSFVAGVELGVGGVEVL